MKQKVLILILAMAFSIVGCGSENAGSTSQGEPIKQEENSVGAAKDEQVAVDSEEYVFCNEFTFFKHNFAYTDSFQFDKSSKGGKTLAKDNEYWISLDTLDYYGLTTPVESFDEIVEVCQKGVIMMLEDRYRGIFDTNKTVQQVSETAEVNGKYVNALKVKGTFDNTFSGEKVEYVAFYFMTKVGDVSYPFYMIGIVREGTLEDMEAYMDASLDYISPVE